jgi:hypothetical protein
LHCSAKAGTICELKSHDTPEPATGINGILALFRNTSLWDDNDEEEVEFVLDADNKNGTMPLLRRLTRLFFFQNKV